MGHINPRSRILAIILIGMVVSPMQAGAVDVSQQMKTLVEADWLRADRDFSASAAAQGSDGRFLRAHIEQVVERGRQLAWRLTQQGGDAPRLRDLSAQLQQLGTTLDSISLNEDARKSRYLEAKQLVRRDGLEYPFLELSSFQSHIYLE